MTCLELFIEAQKTCYAIALEELRLGRKQNHWMWYVFPQLAGLGQSPDSELYGIADLAEAREFLAHSILGPRLREVSETMLTHRGRQPQDILGNIDALKLRSSATLFDIAAEGAGPYSAVLDGFYDGERCKRTMEILNRTARKGS